VRNWLMHFCMHKWRARMLSWSLRSKERIYYSYVLGEQNCPAWGAKLSGASGCKTARRIREQNTSHGGSSVNAWTFSERSYVNVYYCYVYVGIVLWCTIGCNWIISGYLTLPLASVLMLTAQDFGIFSPGKLIGKNLLALKSSCVLTWEWTM
jgi:hypothetical protein